MDELDEIEISIPAKDLHPERNYSVHAYGAIRTGEDIGDIETWGFPHDYEIYANQYIDSPIGR